MLGQALRDRRIDAGLTLQELAARSGFTFGFLGECERGEKVPSLDALAELAAAYGVLATDLLDGVYPYGSDEPPEEAQPARTGEPPGG